MLAALDRARDSERRFLADAWHELRTPVTACWATSSTSARHGADAELLAELRHDASRLGRLVDDLLTLERGRSGEPERRPVRLDALVRAAAEAQPRVELGRVDPALADGDADALRRALRQPDRERGRPRAARRPGRRLADLAEGRAAITVRDAGNGSPAEDASTCSSASGGAPRRGSAAARASGCRSPPRSRGPRRQRAGPRARR